MKEKNQIKYCPYSFNNFFIFVIVLLASKIKKIFCSYYTLILKQIAIPKIGFVKYLFFQCQERHYLVLDKNQRYQKITIRLI